LTDEQLQALASAWDSVQDSDTPMADLRGKLTDESIVDFISKYNTNNIELRALATSARGSLEHRHAGNRKAELEAILAAVAGKGSYDEKRAALIDLLGHDIGDLSVDHFIADAQQELDGLNNPDAQGTAAPRTPDVPATTNRELAESVSDLLDGQLAVDVADRVHYGAGATALGKNVGGKYVSPSQLRDIAAHADQIRDGLAERNQSDQPDVSTEDVPDGDQIDQEAALRRYEAHTQVDEAPAEGGDIDSTNETSEPIDTTLNVHDDGIDGDEIDQRAAQYKFEAHTQVDEAPAEGGDIDSTNETSEPIDTTLNVHDDGIDGDEIDQRAAQYKFDAHTQADEAPAEGGDVVETTPIAGTDAAPTDATDDASALDGDAIDEDAARRRYEAHTHEDEAPAEGPEISDDEPQLAPEPESAPRASSPELSLSFIDESDDAEALARDAARAKWRETLQSGGRFKRFIKNLWMGENGVAGPYVYRKYYHEALAQIKEAGDVLVHESGDAAARRRAQLATIARFQEGFLHEEAGEQRAELAGDSAYGVAVKDLIRRYAGGEFADEAAFMEERGRVLEQLREAGHDDLLGEGGVRIDNMFLIAEQVKAMADHGDSIDRVLEGMKIYSGEARSHVRTEAHLNAIDRAIDKLDRSKFGGLVSPETMGALAAIGLGIFQVGRGGLATAAGVTVPGLVGGGLAALRESKRLKDDRMLHGREMAMGKEYDQNAKRRVEMATARYEAVAARDLTAQLDVLFDHEEEMTPDQVQQAYQMLAAVEARVRMSDRRGADLVSFSDATMVEVERQALDVARARAKVELASRLDQLPADFRTRIGIEDGDTVDAALDRYTDVVTSIEQDMTEKDKVFNKIRRKRIATAAAVGFGTSFLMGVGMQEIVAFANPGYEGLVEHLVNPNSANGAVKQTLLEGLAHQLYPKTYNSFPLGNHGNALELPSGYSVVQEGKNAFGILDANGNHVIDHINLNKNGSLTHQSVLELRQHNIDIQDNGTLIQHSTPKTMSVPDYNKLHAKDVTHITRDFWNDNDTSSPNYDHNELGLSYGGKGGTGIGPNGSVRMSVAGMTEGGSWHGSHHVSWADAAEHGKLKLAITGSRGTQTEAYMIDVKPNGSIDIPANSPAAKFFSVEHGHVKFHGGFVEVVETRGTSHGVTHVAPLATTSGDHSLHHITENVPGERYVPRLKLTPPENLQVEGFAGPPIVMRNPLERVRRGNSDNPYYRDRYRGADFQVSQAEYDEMVADISPQLRTDENAELNIQQELDWYRNRVAERNGPEHLRSVDALIDESPELRDFPADVELVDTIPVRADTESKNIYRVLSLYAKQDPEYLAKSLMLLNVNWLDVNHRTPEQIQAVQSTLDEIERARHDFPQLRIAVIQREYKKTEVDKTQGVMGYVARDMLDVALLAAQRAVADGKRPADKDFIILRNDADAQGISRHHFRSMIEAAQKNKGIDVFKGVTRFGTELAEHYPGFGLVMNMQTNLASLAALRGSVHTGGANFAVRASTLAAVGGLGELHYTGAASDDVSIGRRVVVARRRSASGAHYGSKPLDATSPTRDTRRIGMLVGGATIDTDAQRFITPYLDGEYWQSTWDRGKKGGFSDAQGGHRARDTGAPLRQSEQFTLFSDEAYRNFELNVGHELAYAPKEDQKRMLSLIFKDTPGAYTLVTDKDGKLVFGLTKSGRQYLRKWVARDRAGHHRSFGRRQAEALYGHGTDQGRRKKTGALVAA
jgi:hypothetical protein